jgi:hypothetical protein
MTFHETQITTALQQPTQYGIAKIGGHEFPSPAPPDEKMIALERAMVSISTAIGQLAHEVARLSRELEAIRRR